MIIGNIRKVLKGLICEGCYCLKQRQITRLLWWSLKNNWLNQCYWTQGYYSHQMKSGTFPKIILCFTRCRIIAIVYGTHWLLCSNDKPIHVLNDSYVNFTALSYCYAIWVLKCYERFVWNSHKLSFRFKAIEGIAVQNFHFENSLLSRMIWAGQYHK